MLAAPRMQIQEPCQKDCAHQRKLSSTFQGEVVLLGISQTRLCLMAQSVCTIRLAVLIGGALHAHTQSLSFLYPIFRYAPGKTLASTSQAARHNLLHQLEDLLILTLTLLLLLFPLSRRVPFRQSKLLFYGIPMTDTTTCSLLHRKLRPLKLI